MDLKTFFKELWDLIKNEKKLILIVTIIVILLVGVLQFFLILDTSSSQNTEQGENSAVAELFIEQEDLGLFTNSYLVEILLQQPELVSSVEDETGVGIQSVIDEYGEENTPIYTTEDPVNVERNTSSNVFTLTVQLGSEDENLAVAEAYYNWLEQANTPFFSDKTVYTVSEPEITETQTLAQTEDSVSIQNILVQLFVGLIGGVVIGIIFAFIKAILDSKIRYSFTYGWHPNDIYLKNEKDVPAKTIAQDVLRSEHNNISLISESPVSNELKEQLEQFNDKNVSIFSSVSNLPLDMQPREFVLMIQRNQTNKNWYQKQRRELKLYPTSMIKIVEYSD